MKARYILLMSLFLGSWIFASLSVNDTKSRTFMPIFQPTLEVSKAPGKIEIDGNLEDIGWVGAARADNFSEHYPGDQTLPPVKTKAYITYDNNNLYIAFVCYDHPDKVRASFCERDKIENDDIISVCLDTYGEASWAYVFYVNPHGIQGDALWGSVAGEDANFDLLWRSAGTITRSGYQVEMAIPFSSLRFPDQENQEWRVEFERYHPRETRAEYSWASYDRDERCWPCQWGTITGISDVRPGRGIELVASAIGYQVGSLDGSGTTLSPYGFNNANPDGELSIGGKYSLSSNATIEVTVNPDFSQIETDAGKIDINYPFAFFYPERRPFFQEGSDLFLAAIRTVHTRAINNPQFAAKGTYRSGRTSIGYLLARDEDSPIMLPHPERTDIFIAGKSTSNVFRLRRSVGTGSQLGIIFTDRRFDDNGSGTNITHDGRIRLMPSLRLVYHFSLNHKKELDDPVLSARVPYPDSTFSDKYTRAFDGESFWGYTIFTHLSWQSRTWHASCRYWELSPTYRQDNGFLPQNNFRDGYVIVGYYHRPEGGPIELLNPYIRVNRQWEFSGRPKDKVLQFNLETRLNYAQAILLTQYVRHWENYRNVVFDDIASVYQSVSFKLAEEFSAGIEVTYGNQLIRNWMTTGRSLDLSLNFALKLIDRFLVQQWLDYTRTVDRETDEELYDGYIYRVRLDYQFSTPLSMRLIAEYNDFQKNWSIDPLVTYRISPFSVFYIGSTYNYRELSEEKPDGYDMANRLTDRQFFAKLQYLFQI